jgi:hypothetical protein
MNEYDITKFGSRFNEFIYGGTYSTEPSEVPEPLTLDTIKKMAGFLGPPPPSIRVQYGPYLDPDDIIKVDARKFEKLKSLFNLPYSFVEMADVWYIIGKNMIEKFQDEGIKVYGIKDNG